MKRKAAKVQTQSIDCATSKAFAENLFHALPLGAFLLSADSLAVIAVSGMARSKHNLPDTPAPDLRLNSIFPGLSELQLRRAAKNVATSKCGSKTLKTSSIGPDKTETPVELRLQRVDDADRSFILVLEIPAHPASTIDRDVLKLAQVAKNNTKSLIILDNRGRTQWMNSAFTQLTGFSLEEVEGKHVAEFLRGPSSANGPLVNIEDYLTCCEDYHIEQLITNKLGKEIWIELNIQSMCDDTGEIEYIFANLTDISKRKRIEDNFRKLNRELAEEKNRFELAAIGSNNGIWDWDIQAGTVYYSARFRELLGYTEEEFPNELDSFTNIVHPDDSERAYKIVKAHLDNKEPYDLEYRLKTKDGSYRWFRSKGQALWDMNDEAVRMAGSITDISDHKTTEEAIKRLAKTDALTGLPNRTLFHERLQSAITTANREGGMVGVMLLDLDHFKDINDTLGHPAGDELLREVSNRIKLCVRDSDTVARLGGDEFAVVAAKLTDASDTKLLAGRIVDAISKPFNLEGQRVQTAASIGITIYPESTGNSDDLLRNADVALYEAKGAGRGTFMLYDSTMNKRVQARRLIEKDLHQALENDELELYYQPQIELSSQKIIGAEALLRWNHPERGLVMPSEFIPIAEATRMIIPLGEWVLAKACEQNKKWQIEGLPPLVVAINVSPLQFKHQDMLPNLFEAVAASGLDPKWLEIEITEAAAMEKGAVRVLNELKEFGVQLAIDDFGTGYSSLNRLRSFPVDRLKIDRSFVHSIDTLWDRGAISNSIIQLGHSLNISVIAEGVETQEELDRLRQMGCDDVQGFLFSPPLPAKQFAEFVRFHAQHCDLSKLAPTGTQLITKDAC